MKIEIDTECPQKDRFKFLMNLQILMNEQDFKWAVSIGNYDRIIMTSGEKK